MKRGPTALFLAATLIVSAAVVSDSRAEDGPPAELKKTLDLYPFVERYVWKEFFQGAQLLEESGTLKGAGAMGIFESERAVYRLKGEVSWGEVDYDGHTMGGTPVQTKVNYLVLKGEGDAGVRYALGRSSVEPFWGVGYKWWRRDLEHSAAAIGYLETWQSLYVKVGAHAEYGGAGPVRPFVEAALRLSVYNRNKADFGFAVVSTEPGNTVTPYVEAGLQVWRLKGSVYYDGIDFPQSDEVTVDIGGTPFVFFQPKSRGYIYGAKLSASF